jgi:hypothetical protein
MRFKITDGQVTTVDEGKEEIRSSDEQVLSAMLPIPGTNGEVKPAHIHALILKDLQEGPRETSEGESDRQLEAYKHALWSLYYTRLALYERDGK